jgi:hypothetical protein
MRTALSLVLWFGGVFCCLAQSGSMNISSFPTAAVANGHDTAAIRVTIINGSGTTVPDGTQVQFETDLGTFRDGGLATTRNGVATAVLVAGNVTGTATINAKALGLSVAPAHLTFEFVGSQDLLNSAKDYVEIVCQKPLQFSPADRKIQAEDSEHKVSIRYRDLTIEADKVELNLETYELRAVRATMKTNRVTRKFSELNYHLDSKTGYGVTTVQVREITGIAGVGRVIVLHSTLNDRYGLASVKGSKVEALHGIDLNSYFKINEFDEPPALITARKAVVYRNKEVQFQNAELYAGDARVLRLPLYRAPLTGDKRLFTEQILNVNDNQIAVTYPYYLSLKPGETSFLRFHMGDSTGLFGSSNRPQLDYEIDWERGSENYGGFLFSGLGQAAWGLELHQYYRFDNSMTGFAQIESPATRSVNGSMNLNKSIAGGYSANLSSSITQSLLGTSLTDQSTSLILQRDPMKVGNFPVRFSYGATASHVSTTAPIAIQRQDAYGLQGQLTMLEQKLSPSTKLDGGLTVSHLMGTNVNGGLSLGANMFLRSHIQSVNFGFGYTFTEDALQSERVGHHMITGLTSYDRGNLILSLNGSTSLDIQNIQYTSSVRYRLKKLWSLAYTSQFYKYLGGSFLDYNFGVYYTYLGSKQIGLIWSYRTNRLGFQLYGD